MEIGESLVGAYQRHVRQCHTVAFNQFIPGKQGEIDVIGIGGSPADVNEAQLKQVASVVDGKLRYWFIRDVGSLQRRFEALALGRV